MNTGTSIFTFSRSSSRTTQKWCFKKAGTRKNGKKQERRQLRIWVADKQTGENGLKRPRLHSNTAEWKEALGSPAPESPRLAQKAPPSPRHVPASAPLGSCPSLPRAGRGSDSLRGRRGGLGGRAYMDKNALWLCAYWVPRTPRPPALYHCAQLGLPLLTGDSRSSWSNPTCPTRENPRNDGVGRSPLGPCLPGYSWFWKGQRGPQVMIGTYGLAPQLQGTPEIPANPKQMPCECVVAS